ncbi:uncharacterized protein LOC128736283 [Sabethes cyaneus]|uniref:uncharacterized protein LOC128736282 n=1 Tax=Sabethes cyaneus TaxID=53552 RepID=UPI00237E4DFA|nr:uncharacterized protein LOC128736282 [Sabethes cyaneus]XP_053686732.1 uncharacterized protein LOC128736283 [Sabethes cyaneus]
MNESKIKVQTFNDLRHSEEQLKLIPLKKIARVSLNSLRRQDSDFEVYEFLFTKVLYCFNPNEFETEISQLLLPELKQHLKKISIEIKDSALSTFLVDNFKSLISFADVLLKFAGYVIEVSETCRLHRTVTIFLEFLVNSYDVIGENIQLRANQDDLVKQLFTLCQKIQYLIVKLLAPVDEAGVYFQHLDTIEEFNCFQEAIVSFCKIGSLTISIDTRLSMAIWKALVKLISMHDKKLTAKDSTWLHERVLQINNDIQKLLQSSMASREDSKAALVRIKFSGFLLKVLLKLVLTIKNDFVSYDCLLNTMVSIEKDLSVKEIDESLATEIWQHVMVGYMTLVKNTFRCPGFAKALTSAQYHFCDEVKAHVGIIIYVISQIIADCRNVSTTELYVIENNLLMTCVRILANGHILFNNQNDLYRQMVVHLSGFVIICTKLQSVQAQKIVEETLARMILQGPYWVGIIGLDIWSVYLRYRPVTLLLQYFMFWKEVRNEFSLFNSQPQAVFVSRLLQNMYVFLPPNMQQRVWTEFPVTERTNYKLWITIGLKHGESKQVLAAEQLLVKNLEDCRLHNSSQITLEKVGDFLCIARLLCETCHKNISEVVVSKIKDLWEAITDNEMKIMINSSIIAELIALSNLSIYRESVVRSDMWNFESLSLSAQFNALQTNELLSENLLRQLSDNSNVLIRVISMYLKTKRKQSVLNNTAEIVCSNWLKQRLLYQNKYKVVLHGCTSEALSNIEDLLITDDNIWCSTPMENPGSKRRKIANDIEALSPISKDNCVVTSTIYELNRNVEILRQMKKEKALNEHQLSEICRIGSILSTFTDMVD